MTAVQGIGESELSCAERIASGSSSVLVGLDIVISDRQYRQRLTDPLFAHSHAVDGRT
jgi:hypothetical protein